MLVFFFFFLVITASGEGEFTFNGFNSVNLSLDGTASITNNGLLELTNATQRVSGHAFHRLPLHFRSQTGKTISFYTTFVFAILSETSNLSGHGISFFVSRTRNLEVLATSLPVASCSFLVLIVAFTALIIRRIEYAELLEDWELKYRPHRFSYKDLYEATKGFKESQLLGMGGFGRVYKGVLPTSRMEIAVKKISHGSTQGLREFVAEIVSIGQFHHRNLVQLLGYCRRKGEFLLVYDFMPNGSLDKLLHDCTKTTLNWAQRFQIIKGVASGLLYLHEDWEQIVIHRDIKASNVLLDGDFNGRLGDFGLARLYDPGTDPQTTRVVGTMGYLAPAILLLRLL